MRNIQNSKFKKALEKVDSLAIIGHENIDGDALGSMLGLGELLKQKGLNIDYYAQGGLPEYLEFIVDPKINIIDDVNSLVDTSYDAYILVDIPVHYRIGDLDIENYWDDKLVLNIDHHISNIQDFDIQILDTESSSTCEALWKYFIKPYYPELVNKDIASYIYLGVHTDTGRFAYNTSPETFEIVGQLLSYDIDRKSIINSLFKSHSLDSIKYLGELIDRIQVSDGVLYTYFDERQLEGSNIDKTQAKFIISLLRSVKEAKVYVLMYCTKDGKSIKGSIRTENGMANKLAKKLGGGGHSNASGFKVEIGNMTYKEKIDDIVDNYLT